MTPLGECMRTQIQNQEKIGSLPFEPNLPNFVYTSGTRFEPSAVVAIAPDMQNQEKPKSRSVRLSREQLEQLSQAIHEKWSQENHAGKLTQEVQADLLGIAVPTLKRMRAGEPVDRTTVSMAFKRVGLTWSNPVSETAPPTTEVSVQPVIERTARRWPSILVASMVGVAAFFTAFVLIASRDHARLAPDVELEQPWRKRFYEILKSGTDEYYSGDYAKSRAHIDTAVDMATRHVSADDLANALLISGNLAIVRGSYEDAETQFRKALRLCLDFKKTRMEPSVQESLGDVQTLRGKYPEARKSLNAALEGYQGLQDSVGVSLVKRDLGSLAYRQEHFDEATQWFELALQLARKEVKPDIVADIQGRQGLLWIKQGRANAARDQLKLCLEYWEGKHHARWIAIAKMNLALAEEAVGHLQVAIEYLNASANELNTIGDQGNFSEVTNHNIRVQKQLALRTHTGG